MLFKITLIAVIAYLAACYAYGLFLLYKLYTNKKMQAEIKTPAPVGAAAALDTPVAERDTPQPAYEAPAKAA